MPLDAPPTLCLVQALGDSSNILKILGWIDQRDSDFQKTRSEAQQRVKEAFDEAGIIMPEPIYNVNLRRKQQASETLQAATIAESVKPLVGESADKSADTQPDKAIDEQMRHERRNRSDEDLLSKSAPME